LDQNFPAAVVTSARGASACSDGRQVLLDGLHPRRVEAVLAVAEVQDEHLAVAAQRREGGGVGVGRAHGVGVSQRLF
jgi:hypothetical protein